MRALTTISLCLLLAGPAQALERFHTANRLGISLGWGFGSASLSSFHEGVDEFLRLTQSVNPGLSFQEQPKSGLQINAEIAFRYYFPYFILGQVGCDAVYNWASARYNFGGGTGTMTSDQLAMEIPILIGGYYPFLGRLYVFGAIGPSPFFFPRSWWDPGTDFKASGGVGMHVLAGAEFLVSRAFAVGLELRYRLLRAKDLVERNSGVMVTGKSYDLDLSGISLGITLRAFAM